jgi:SAM-dependent methyltransferase
VTARTELAALAGRWRDDLAAWAIPDEILSAVTVSPWTPSAALFARRADAELRAPRGPSYDRALEALPPGGSVLDVGAGAGAAGLPAAAERRGSVIAVDMSADMLDELAERAAARGLRSHCVRGRWPETASPSCTADVAMCKDVIYNVPDLPAFFSALTDHARHRVVVELTDRHPLAPLNPLWLRLHGLRRPERPVGGDAFAIAAAMRLRPRAERWIRPAHGPYGTFDDLVEVVRTRLCLPADRDGDVAAALRALGTDPAEPYLPGARERAAMTLWWPGRAR